MKKNQKAFSLAEVERALKDVERDIDELNTKLTQKREEHADDEGLDIGRAVSVRVGNS